MIKNAKKNLDRSGGNRNFEKLNLITYVFNYSFLYNDQIARQTTILNQFRLFYFF